MYKHISASPRDLPASAASVPPVSVAVDKRSKRAFNNAANPFIQPKLEVGQPNDRYEHEADAVADKVMRMPEQNFVQRKCAACEGEEKLQRKPLSETVTPFIQAKSDNTPIVNNQTAQSIASSRGGGSAMDSHTNSFMSSRFGMDFSDVKIHTGREAVQLSRDINARAFTTGKDIYFNEGQYQPGVAAGKHLLAHELTHVVQQSAGIQCKPLNSRPDWETIPIDYDMITDPTERMEMMRADYEKYRWKNALERLQKGELEDTDLQYNSLRNRMTGLKTSEITDLITKIKAFQEQRDKDIKDPDVKDPDKKKPVTTVKIIQWLEVRKVISTPMPDNATVNFLLPGMIDSFSVSINDINITVMPDTSGSNQNETGPTANFTGNFTWMTVGGKITGLKKNGTPFNPTSLEVTILTKYKNSPDDTSGYGKGTTAADKSNETTTLRTHEGQHGTDFITYLTNTPLPVSLKDGINGKLTPAQFSKILAYVKNITKDTCETTDQVGFSQDEFLATAQGRLSGITSCRRP